MSKRLGNAADPFETLEQYGADATRWYMITNSQPWDNLKFDLNGIDEVRRKFFGTLYNTYSFFALYANIDGFTYAEEDLAIEERPEIDRWILSELNTLIQLVDQSFTEYEPTRAGRAISYFVSEHLSNWFVRLSRRRFWKGEYSQDKISAYQTLYTCLETVAQLSSPIAPFYTEKLFRDLNTVSGRHKAESIHLTDMPLAKTEWIDKELEERMEMAQQFSSMVLSLRKKNNLRVRQPLNKMMIPVLNGNFKGQIDLIKDLILSEVNVKTLEFMPEDSPILVKKIKANFKNLGPKYGKLMKEIANAIQDMDQNGIKTLEKEGVYPLTLGNETIEIGMDDVEIITDDIPGWLIASSGLYTVALDTTLTEELISEGKARDLVNKIQSLRKEKGFEVTDKISIILQKHPDFDTAFKNNYSYICSETLTESFELSDKLPADSDAIEISESNSLLIEIKKI